MTSGSYDSEVSWEVTCSDGAAASGGAPYPLTDFTLTLGATCTLSMLDSYGDGWNGATWIACVTAPGGECSSITLPTGSVGQETVVISVGEASPNPGLSPSPSSPGGTGPDAQGTIEVTGGGYPYEISWSLSCSDGTSITGGAPYPQTPFTVGEEATCTLSMQDSYGDGWNDATWTGCVNGICSTHTMSDGSFDSAVITPGSRRRLQSSAVFGTIAVSSGAYRSEVGWSLSCSDGTAISNGVAPYSNTNVAIADGATCTLTMTDTYGDGWNGATWTGFHQSTTLASGAAGSFTFIVDGSQCQATMLSTTSLQVDFPTALTYGQEYTVSFPQGYLLDGLGRSLAGLSIRFTAAANYAAMMQQVMPIMITSTVPPSVTPDPGQGTRTTWGSVWQRSTKIDPTSPTTSVLRFNFNQPIEASPAAAANVTIEEMDWFDTSVYYTVCSLPITDSQIEFSVTSVTITPYTSCRLFRTGQFRLHIPGGLIRNSAGVAWGGSGQGNYYYFNTIPDTVKPSVSYTSPADSSQGATEDQPFIITFNSDDFVFADKNTPGTVTFKAFWQDTLIETHVVSLDDTTQVWSFPYDEPAQVEIWPTYNWWSECDYQVSISDGAFYDASLMPFTGQKEFTFRTTNTIAPMNPKVRAAFDASNTGTITITWLSLGQLHHGQTPIDIVDVQTNSSVLTIPTTDREQVSFSPLPDSVRPSHMGNMYDVVVRIRTPLPGPAMYAVRWGDSAFRDSAGNGVLPESSSQFNFSTKTALTDCEICAQLGTDCCSFPPVAAVTATVFNEARVTVAGTVSDFGEDRISEMTVQVAGRLGVSPSNVEITVTPGSVIVTIRVGYADLATASFGDALLQNKVMSTAAAANFLATPSYPTVTVEAVSVANVETSLGNEAGDNNDSSFVVILVAVVAVLGVGIVGLVIYIFVLRKKAASKATASAQPTMVSVVSSSGSAAQEDKV